MPTLGNRLQDRGANNLDFLRFAAALLVMFSHCFGLLGYAQDPLDHFSGWESFASLGLRIFFCMSGTLITASWCHAPTARTFAHKRVLRIFPGLLAAVLFCTFVAGPLGTVLGPWQYFTGGDTYQFLINAVLPASENYLPGVFALNPCQGVNGSLWTLPYELLCYLAVLICGWLRLLTPRTFPATAVVLVVSILQARLFTRSDFLAQWQRPIGSLELCELEFLVGMTAYVYRQWLPIGHRLAAAALAAYLGTLTLPWLGQFVALLAVPYLVLYLAQMRCPQLGRWAQHGDLSYGMYVYAFPVQQLFIGVFGVGVGAGGLFALSATLTAGLAYLSWHFVEKPALAWRWSQRPPAAFQAVSSLSAVNGSSRTRTPVAW